MSDTIKYSNSANSTGFSSVTTLYNSESVNGSENSTEIDMNGYKTIRIFGQSGNNTQSWGTEHYQQEQYI